MGGKTGEGRTTPASPASEEELIRSALPLVGHVVREMLGRVPAHVDRDDLTSAGMAALVAAAKSFDPERGVGFTGYAAMRVRGAIVDELRSLDWASRSVRRRARQVGQVKEELAATLGRTPTDAEIAAAMGVAVHEIQAHHEDVSRAAVLSLHGFDEGAADELLPARTETPERVIEARERMAYLRDAVAVLPERLRVVVEGYFFEERPMAELAEELGVTESRISQLRAEAVTLLREAMNKAFAPEQVTPHARPNGAAARRREAYYAEVAARSSYRARLAAPAYEPFSA